MRKQPVRAKREPAVYISTAFFLARGYNDSVAFSNPKSNLEQFGLQKGHIVADLGAGSGFYSIEAAKLVAPGGKVYAVDIQKDLLARLKAEAIRMKVYGIEVMSGDLEALGGSRLREGAVDRVIISNILFQIENKKNLAAEIKRILKPGGLVLVIDWTASFGHMGPHPDQVLYKDACMKLFREAGFTYVREIEAGDQHYGMIFRK